MDKLTPDTTLGRRTKLLGTVFLVIVLVPVALMIAAVSGSFLLAAGLFRPREA